MEGLHSESQIEKFKEGLKAFISEDNKTLTESIVFVDDGCKDHASGWFSQSTLSKASGFNSQLQDAYESENGTYLFALSFSNCHSKFAIEEPALKLKYPLQSIRV